MYKITFNTENFNDKRRKSWENQLNNDFAVAINGVSFICDSREDALNRLGFIAGYETNINSSDKENYFILEDERYSKQIMHYKMPGFAQGYVRLEKYLDRAEQEGESEIPFNSFYDLRQGNFFKGCFIEITVE